MGPPPINVQAERHKLKYMKSTTKIACLSLLAASAMHVGAAQFAQLTLSDLDTAIRNFSDGTTYSPLFFAGSELLGGCRFNSVRMRARFNPARQIS